MGVMESMKRGYNSIVNDPGKHLDKVKSNVRSQAAVAANKAKEAAKEGANVATRGAGLGPARGLRDVLLEAKRKITGS
jgi:hypothetical protein